MGGARTSSPEQPEGENRYKGITSTGNRSKKTEAREFQDESVGAAEAGGLITYKRRIYARCVLSVLSLFLRVFVSVS